MRMLPAIDDMAVGVDQSEFYIGATDINTGVNSFLNRGQVMAPFAGNPNTLSKSVAL